MAALDLYFQVSKRRHSAQGRGNTTDRLPSCDPRDGHQGCRGASETPGQSVEGSGCQERRSTPQLRPVPTAVLRGGDLRIGQRHGGHPGQWRHLPHHRGERAKRRSRPQHPQPHALLRHVRLLGPVCLPRECVWPCHPFVTGPEPRRGAESEGGEVALSSCLSLTSSRAIQAENPQGTLPNTAGPSNT